jgi:DNA polymerase
MNSEIAEIIDDVKEQVLYLQGLGIAEFDAAVPDPEQLSASVSTPRSVPDAPPRATAQKAPATSGSRLASFPSLSRAGTERAQTAAAPEAASTPAAIDQRETPKDETLFGEIGPTLKETEDTIEIIRAEIGECTRCDLCSLGRKQIVHSTGNWNADLMFVGEAPGADEDEQGFPFVGRAGQLLTKIIEGIGLNRDDVFIGNINRCRPPGNRQPVPAETAACRPFLLREVAVVRPKVIVVLGNTATQNLLDIKTPISKIRGQFQDYFGVKVMPTFHPAYLLRDPHKKKGGLGGHEEGSGLFEFCMRSLQHSSAEAAATPSIQGGVIES